MELENISQIEQAAEKRRPELIRLGFAIIFIVGIMLFVGMRMGDVDGGYLLIAASMIGGYMAMNSGANNV